LIFHISPYTHLASAKRQGYLLPNFSHHEETISYSTAVLISPSRMADHNYPFREASQKEVTPIGKEKSLLITGIFQGVFSLTIS
jgi:hypothetical protein